ncbi:phosphatase PAP2 family protein [Butyrivibrio sp. MC2013]|uniref:phosphatase PAP2 family protein n=1 Tax=Butyrivibrio sp. MC2013 TaxID=1280686 RepID=UPI0004015CB3|nr:phosphatase PAP2 family protein [Butyrivibrio sp. MC2013]
MIFKDKYSQPITRERVWKTFLMAVPTGLYAIMYIIWFNWIEKRPVVHFTEMHVAIDDKIPFMEIFVVPYILWFGFVFFCTAFPLLKFEVEDYWKFMAFLSFGMTLFLVLSTFVPTIQYLRPAQMPRDNIFTDMVSFFYTHDTPTNVFPSMHAYNAVGGAISLHHSRRIGRKGRIASSVMAMLIVVSTMFIKQHSATDVIGALALSLIAYYFVYRTNLVTNLLGKLGVIDLAPEEAPEEIFVK